MTEKNAIWHRSPTIGELNEIAASDTVGFLGLTFTEVGDDVLRARLPVDERTTQAHGLLNGGVSCVVSESMGSIAANFCVDSDTHYCVGVDINASHLRSATSGLVYAETRPLRIGRRTQFWETRLTGEDNRLVCISRLTTAVIER